MSDDECRVRQGRPLMSNEDMRSGRFLRWHTARRKAAWIAARLAEGLTVYVVTYTKATKLSAKHADSIKATKSGLYMRSGKSWICIDGCALRAA